MIIKFNHQTDSYNVVITDKDEAKALANFKKNRKQAKSVGFTMKEVQMILKNLDAIIYPPKL